MKALILAGGFGTRLKEIGQVTPKGLLEQKGKPLLEHTFLEIASLKDCDQIALISNGKYYNQYKNWLAQKNHPITLLDNGVLNPNERLGALGDLDFAVDSLHWQDETILVLPSDTYFEFSLQEIVAIYKKTNNFVTVVRDVGDKSIIANRLGCAILSEGEMVEFIEKPSNPPSTYAAIPFYLYTPEVLKLLKTYKNEGNEMDTPGSIIPWLLEKKIPVKTLVVTSMTLDVGTPKDLTELQNL